jgi:glycosyltransferase involved in cell wall biosynthesis
VPEQLDDLVAEVDPSIRVRVNVPRQEVLERMARSVAFVYTLTPDSAMGCPMSIIEAMLCGTMVIAPDRDEAYTVVGPHVLTYRTSEDIVQHVREILAAGSGLDSARQDLVQRAGRHRDPGELRRLHDELQACLTSWRYARG